MRMGYGILATSLKPSCNEKGTVETALSELAKARTGDLIRLAVPCLSNEFEETGGTEMWLRCRRRRSSFVRTEYVALGAGQKRDKM